MSVNPVYNIKKWVEDNRDMLKPPVGNKLVYEDPDIIVILILIFTTFVKIFIWK